MHHRTARSCYFGDNALVRRALTGRAAANAEVAEELARHYPVAPAIVDPFSGRGMIPLEAARLGLNATGIDYSPFASLGGALLADYALRDWSHEPALPFGNQDGEQLFDARLLNDVRVVLDEVGKRYMDGMRPYFPEHNGQHPWGYLWASTLPCQECGRRFPLVGQLLLRQPRPRSGDVGQSFRLDVDHEAGTFRAEVHDGAPTGQPTRVQSGKSKYSSSGKVAVCPFCDHVHPKAVHTRLSLEGLRNDALLVAADLDDTGNKVFRSPTDAEIAAAALAADALREEPPFGVLGARPDEQIPPGNTWTIQSLVYGDKVYGDLCVPRQTLTLINIARAISDVSDELLKAGASQDYTRALAGYATAAMMRQIRRSTRGARLQITGGARVGDLFVNQSCVSFSYDWFETGLSNGPGSWSSLANQTVTALRGVLARGDERPAHITRGTALALPFRDNVMDAVVTDPPYDDMIDYSDSSDLFYVWAKRAMSVADPSISFTVNPHGVQEKDDEVIVKRGGSQSGDHRTQAHYDASISKAFAEARRVVTADGVVTIVFGHGDPDVWHRLLSAINQAGLMLTGSWPAKTEQGGAATGAANIVTTLTMSCRPAAAGRPQGKAHLVEAEVRRAVQQRIPSWEAAGLAPTDQLMASAGPAMEAVGRYSQVLDHVGEPIDPAHYLVVARKAVVDATSVPIENLPIDTFDARTRFALGWVRLYRRVTAAKSEARWQALAADLTMDELRGVLREADSGVRFAPSTDWKGTITPTSSVIDVAMAMAKEWPGGLDSVAQVLIAAQRDEDDAYLWATLGYLSSLLPEGDPDAAAWTSLVRARRGIGNVTRGVVSARREADEAKDRQHSLFDTDTAGEMS